MILYSMSILFKHSCSFIERKIDKNISGYITVIYAYKSLRNNNSKNKLINSLKYT